MKADTLSLRCAQTDICAIRSMLMSLGIGLTYKGFKLCTYAIQLAVNDPDRLIFISKCLYPNVAKHFGISPTPEST